MGSGTQYTVNNQMVNATLMNIADNPTNVQLPGVYKNVRALGGPGLGGTCTFDRGRMLAVTPSVPATHAQECASVPGASGECLRASPLASRSVRCSTVTSLPPRTAAG